MGGRAARRSPASADLVSISRTWPARHRAPPRPPRTLVKPNRSMPSPTVIPVLVYPDVRAAVAWLGAAFGCVERLRIGDHRAQLALGSGHLVAANGPSAGSARSMVLVRVADVDAHYRRAEEAGARIVMPPAERLRIRHNSRRSSTIIVPTRSRLK